MGGGGGGLKFYLSIRFFSTNFFDGHFFVNRGVVRIHIVSVEDNIAPKSGFGPFLNQWCISGPSLALPTVVGEIYDSKQNETTTSGTDF